MMKKSFALVCLAILFWMPAYTQNANIDLLRVINANRTPFFDGVFILLSNTVAWLAYSVPAALIAFALVNKNKEGTRKALLIAISALSAALLSNILKHSINEVRPFITYPFITKLSDGGSPSFPSGHTTDAFVLATALSLGFRKWYIILVTYVWACAVGYSRMYLGVHYPSDVLGGMVTGIGCAFACYVINRQMLNTASLKETNA